MKMNPVQSSNIKAIGYHAGTLHVEYANGTYEYKDVAEHVYKDLMSADSKGKFLNKMGVKGTKI